MVRPRAQRSRAHGKAVRVSPVPRQRVSEEQTQLTPEVSSHRRPLRRFQVAATFVLVLGAATGSYSVFGDREAEQPQQPALTAEIAASLPFDDISREMAQARAMAKAKAEAAAAAEAERVRKANEVAKKQAEAAKNATLPVPSSCAEYTGNRALGCAILLEVGFGLDQMPCLEQMWTKESNWRAEAHNSSSGAHGIPQALPAEKMKSYGADYLTNPVTQIRWGLDYIRNRYGTPCQAWSFWQSHHYY